MAKEQKWMKVERLVHVDWNPRTPEELKWDHPEMVPLIASVKSVGVVQPIAVWADKAAIEHCKVGLDPIDGVVIAGNRRLEAARAAGLGEIPALVFTDISSAQAQEITRLENEVRLGVDPLKDASLIGSMLGLGYSQKEIAAHFGVSEARICRRRKLLDLCPKLRERAEAADGNITIDALERIAVYPLEIQEACAKDIINKAKQSSTPLRWRDVGWVLSRNTKALDLAGFSTKECRSCPNRTGAMPDLFGETDTKALGRCLGADCYARKLREHMIGVLREKYGDVEMIDGAKSGIKEHYTARNDSAFGEKKSKARPVLWYWIDTCENAWTFFGPTVEEYKRLNRKKAEAAAKAEKEAEAKDEKAKAKEAERRAVLTERDDLVKSVENAVAAVADKAWKKVDYASWSKSRANVKLLDDTLRKYLKDTAQRTALAKLLVTCFDCDIGIDDEVVEFCGAFPDFAKKCGIKNEDFTAITQARASLEKFYKEHSDLKPSGD